MNPYLYKFEVAHVVIDAKTNQKRKAIQKE